MPMFHRERGLHELYADDPERADALVFGRRTGATRRGFLGGSGLATMTAMIGAPLAFSELLPGGLVPKAFAQASKEPKILKMDGKAELIVLGDRPLVAETPAHLLDDDVTPTEKFFIRNNGNPPEAAKDPDAWEITIDGEVNKPLKITVGDTAGASVAAIDSDEREARQVEAARSVKGDGFVQDLVNMFDGKVVDSTIRQKDK